MLRALQQAALRGARIASICIGAFALAAAGLLDGRTATTHSEHAGELARRFPRIRVRPDVLYVDEGQVLTSAITRPVPEAGSGLAPTCAWAITQLGRPLTIAELAHHAGYSERSFARHFVAETGMTPVRWLTAQRLLEARRLLEATDLSIEDISRRCGLGTAANLRLHLAREAATTPTAYRAAFQGRPPSVLPPA